MYLPYIYFRSTDCPPPVTFFVSGEIVLRHRARCAMSREPSPRAEPPGRGAADEGVDAAADDDMTMATAASTRTTRTT